MQVGSTHVITGRGRVLAGVLDGDGQLAPGDLVRLASGPWEVLGIERRSGPLAAASAGDAVGVFVDVAADLTGAEGASVAFERRPTGMPALTPGGFPVPDQAVLVGVVRRRLSPGVRFATLVLDGMRVAVVAPDGNRVLDAAGDELSARAEGTTHIVVGPPGGGGHRLVGPLPQWGRRGQGAQLCAAGARLTPDPRLLPDSEGRAWNLAVTPASARVRWHHLWQPALLAMLATRGVTIGAPPAG